MDPCPRCGDPYAPLGRADDGRPLRYHCNTCGWIRIPDPVTRKLHDAPMGWQPPWRAREKVMKIEQIEERLDEIARLGQDDNEEAHWKQDKLYCDVLEAIAEGVVSDPGAAARAVLKAREIDFDRWYA